MTIKWRAGDAAPWFTAPLFGGNDRYAFESVGGRHVLMLFLPGMGGAEGAAALRLIEANRTLFDDEAGCFFGITRDPEDAATGRIAHRPPGIRWFLDKHGRISDRYAATETPFWLLLDPMLRVVATAAPDQGERIVALLRRLIEQPGLDDHAPVLVIPRVFEPAFCQRLIALYEEQGGKPSGFMRDVGGKTIGVMDFEFKRRLDHQIEDEAVRDGIRQRLLRTLIPMIARSFQFRATRIERFMVGCYDGDGEGGYFRPHRDNSTAGTSHRRFACTINLNAGDYEGGELIFPEFGHRRYQAPTGGAVVFSCSLLHEARPVTRGRRYACLPFLYDEAAARHREEIAQSNRVGEGLAGYRAANGGQ